HVSGEYRRVPADPQVVTALKRLVHRSGKRWDVVMIQVLLAAKIHWQRRECRKTAQFGRKVPSSSTVKNGWVPKQQFGRPKSRLTETEKIPLRLFLPCQGIAKGN